MLYSTGTITAIYEDRFTITFDDDLWDQLFSRNPYTRNSCPLEIRWTYPIGKYLEIQREERLNELGI